MSDSCIQKPNGTIDHTAECRARHKTEMANKARRDKLTGRDKQRVLRQRARQKARKKLRDAS